eukprot:4669795-Pleurochrysis_carterae.AAC.1
MQARRARARAHGLSACWPEWRAHARQRVAKAKKTTSFIDSAPHEACMHRARGRSANESAVDDGC